MTQTPEVISPTVVINAASVITQTTATLNGEIIAGSEELLSQGFECKLASATAMDTSNITLDRQCNNP